MRKQGDKLTEVFVQVAWGLTRASRSWSKIVQHITYITCLYPFGYGVFINLFCFPSTSDSKYLSLTVEHEAPTLFSPAHSRWEVRHFLQNQEPNQLNEEPTEPNEEPSEPDEEPPTVPGRSPGSQEGANTPKGSTLETGMPIFCKVLYTLQGQSGSVGLLLQTVQPHNLVFLSVKAPALEHQQI